MRTGSRSNRDARHTRACGTPAGARRGCRPDGTPRYPSALIEGRPGPAWRPMVLELVRAGGWPMIPILLLSALALALIVERAWTLRRSQVLPPGLGHEVRTWASGGALDPAHIDSVRATSPLGALLAAALDVRGRPREQIRERIEDVGRHLVHTMERYLNTLGSIASAGPLLGLFGTVVGMIQLFLGILDHGIGDVNQLAGGIGKALVCTAAGMVVAIP